MLLAIEQDSNSSFPVLTKKLKAIDTEIKKTQDALIFTGSRSLADRLVRQKKERVSLLMEIKKHENLKSQPGKILLLVNEYAKELRTVGEIIRSKTPGEKKTAIAIFWIGSK